MNRLMIGVAGLTLSLAAATSAQAQILGGGGGLGGSLGGQIGGTVGGLGSNIGNIGSRTTGSLEKSGSLRAEKKVDRRSGRASGSASSSNSLLGSTLSGSGSGSASGSGGGAFDVQAVGTDAVRGTAQGAVGSARGLAQGATSAGGSFAGNAQAMASGMASGGMGQLAAAGSAAANVAGNVAVMPGMAVEDARGRTIGEVESVVANAQGTVMGVLVGVGGSEALLPAGNFTATGDALVSAMGKGEVKKEANRQEEAREDAADSRSGGSARANKKDRGQEDRR